MILSTGLRAKLSFIPLFDPKVEGLMMDLQISPENKFAAAYTNNNQTILLNTLVSEFIIIDSPLEEDETVQGIGKSNFCS